MRIRIDISFSGLMVYLRSLSASYCFTVIAKE